MPRSSRPLPLVFLVLSIFGCTIDQVQDPAPGRVGPVADELLRMYNDLHEAHLRAEQRYRMDESPENFRAMQEAGRAVKEFVRANEALLNPFIDPNANAPRPARPDATAAKTEALGVYIGGGSGTLIPPSGTSGTTEVTVEIFDTGTVNDLDVRIFLFHTWDADLDIYLISPSGTTVELSTDNGGSGDDYIDTYFDDEALVPITSGSAPFTGSFRPEGNLSDFDGEPIEGIWTLRIEDDTGGDRGQLIAWSLHIDYGPSLPPPPNIPPVAIASDVTAECTGTLTSVTLDGSASNDPDGSIVDYTWTKGSTVLGTGATATVALTHGSHTVVLTVTDDDGATGTTTITVVIEDTMPPDINIPAGPVELWPPNHDLVLVASGITASDKCGVKSFNVSVSSNEPESGTGDGDTSTDWVVQAGVGGSYDVYVRAERSGKGTGREYSITATATDLGANVAQETLTVVVPKNRKK